MADPTLFPTRPLNVLGPEIPAGRRAFPKAQELLAGSPIGPLASLQVGWYDTGLQNEVGSFGCIGSGSGLDDLIGTIVRVSYDNRSVFVYVLQTVTLSDGEQLALTRRAFMAVARPSIEVITAEVVVCQ